MPEIDIETQLEKYWEYFERQLSDEERQKLEQILLEENDQFVDPTVDHPVSAVEIARWLNPEPLLDVLKPSYPYFDFIRERLGPRLRLLAYFTLCKRKNLWQAYHSLDEDGCLKLGFRRKPTYELVREFVNERLGVDRFPLLMDWIVRELKVHLEKNDSVLGERVFEDATDIRSLKHDPEAMYSGYYGHAGYKVDITLDASRAVPLMYIPLGITDDEGHCLMWSQEHLVSLGIQEKERIVDLKYATYANIAYSEHHGVSLVYEQAENWVYNQEGDPEEIKRRYQQYHKEKDFVAGANLTFMLRYLYHHGEQQVVGAFYRNQHMKQLEEHPEEIQRKLNERGSKMEGFNGRGKLTTPLDDHPGRRGWQQFLYRTGLVMLGWVFAALIRVQHGVLDHLTNITYIM